MTALFGHELRALAPGRRVFTWLPVAAGFSVLWLVTSPQWQFGIFVAVGVGIGLAVCCSSWGQAIGAVRHEGRDGTLALWLRLQPSPAERLGAKGLAVLAQCAVWTVGLALVAFVWLVTMRTQLAHEGLGWAVGSAPSAARALALALRWMPVDLAVAFAFAPPLVAMGLLCGLARPSDGGRDPGRQRAGKARTVWGWIAFWVLFWLAAQLLSHRVRPLFAVVHTGDMAVLHLVPAGAWDVTLAIAPGVAVTLWPMVLLWVLGAAAYGSAVWRLGSSRIPA